jgi:hypothetical protein
MNIETKLAAQVAAKSAVAVANFATDLVSPKPTGLARLLFAFAPVGAVNWIVNRRLRLSQIKLHEDLFTLTCKAVQDEYSKLLKKSSGSKSAKKLHEIDLIAQMEGYLRLLATVKQSLAYLPDSVSGTDNVKERDSNAADSDLTWWSMFEDFASRPNEPWRTGLLAKALAENDKEPGCIRLKALWEIGMLEADDFGMLAFFCDSAVHIDGKPLVLLDPEEQNKFVLDLGDGMRNGNLAHIIADLIDRGLIQKAITQFDTTEPVTLDHLSGSHRMLHTPLDLKDGQQSALQLVAFGPRDYALDIFRLYEPEFNAASDANFQCLKRTLEEAAITDDDGSFGTVKFDDISKASPDQT